MAAALRHAVLRHVVGHAEATEEFAQAWRNFVIAKSGSLRFAAVQLDADGHHRGFDLGDDVGKADRGVELVSLLGQVLRERARIAPVQFRRSDKRGGAEDGNGGGEKGEAAY